MMFETEDEYDYYCHSCGKGYYNEVGWGPIRCNKCGDFVNKQSPQKDCSDEDYAETMLEFYLGMDDSEDLEGLKNDEHIDVKIVKKLIDQKIKKLNRLKNTLR